jgi:hypothetical protein
MEANSKCFSQKNTIKLSIPAKVAYNADLFKKGITDLLDNLGCRACFSGTDCYFSTIQDYVVNDGLESQFRTENVQALVAPSQSTLSVAMSPKVAHNIKLVDQAIDSIFEEIGCRACCSGHDIHFQNNFAFNFQ